MAIIQGSLINNLKFIENNLRPAKLRRRVTDDQAWEVGEMLSEGMRNVDIARKLDISQTSVKI